MNRFGLVTLLFLAGCNLPSASTPTPDLFATLQASTPLGVSSPNPAETQTPPVIDQATYTPTALINNTAPTPAPADSLSGHIVFTCQIYKVQASNQICIMNADGTGFRRLTTDDTKQHFYPSLSPDGESVIYAAFVDVNNYEVFEMSIVDGSVIRLTNGFGSETAPEISPDGNYISYTYWNATTKNYQIRIANRNGTDANNIPGVSGWDPTWSPDGTQILYASDRSGSIQLYKVNRDGSGRKVVTSLPAIRGRSDWSADGQYIVTYSGPSWNREVFIMNADGTDSRQLTPSGGNSQGPSFSPDGQWVAFTAYFDNYGDDHGCEIYIIRIDGTDLRRLTENDYCDYQPRWGP
jgi:Tol biopolymer transport system component